MSTFQVRPITPHYAKQYDDLVQRGLQGFPAAFETDVSQVSNRPIAKVIDDLKEIEASTGFLLGAFDVNNNLVGTVFIDQRGGPKKLHCADVFFMYVDKEYQGKGLGRLLLDDAIERAKRISGLEQLELSVSINCPDALHLYKTMGFEETGYLKRQIKIENTYYDYVTMWKPLFMV